MEQCYNELWQMGVFLCQQLQDTTTNVQSVASEILIFYPILRCQEAQNS